VGGAALGQHSGEVAFSEGVPKNAHSVETQCLMRRVRLIRGNRNLVRSPGSRATAASTLRSTNDSS